MESLKISNYKVEIGLPFFNLPPVYQKKILSKLHYPDYFRMKQTCKNVYELTENMTKFVNNSDIFYSDIQKKDGTAQLVFTLGKLGEAKWLGSDRSVWYEFPSGIRFNIVKIPDDFEGDFDIYCDLLESYRITAKSIIMGRMLDPTRSQLIELIRILQPKIVDVPRSRFGDQDRHLALLQFTKFDKITTNVSFPESENLSEIDIVVLKFFAITKELDLMVDTRKLTPEQMKKFFVAVFQSLLLEKFPNLKDLDLRGRLPEELNAENVEEMLQNFNPTEEMLRFKEVNSEFHIRLHSRMSYVSMEIGPYRFKMDYIKSL